MLLLAIFYSPSIFYSPCPRKLKYHASLIGGPLAHTAENNSNPNGQKSNQLSFFHPRIILNPRSLVRDFNSGILIFLYSILHIDTLLFLFFLMLYKMVNLSDELSELSHDELQYVIDSYFFWAYNTMKQRGINIRSWKAWRRANPTYCKSFPRIMVEEQIEKMRELIVKARIR